MPGRRSTPDRAARGSPPSGREVDRQLPSNGRSAGCRDGDRADLPTLHVDAAALRAGADEPGLNAVRVRRPSQARPRRDDPAGRVEERRARSWSRTTASASPPSRWARLRALLPRAQIRTRRSATRAAASGWRSFAKCVEAMKGEIGSARPRASGRRSSSFCPIDPTAGVKGARVGLLALGCRDAELVHPVLEDATGRPQQLGRPRLIEGGVAERLGISRSNSSTASPIDFRPGAPAP